MKSASRSAGPRASGFPVHLGPALTPPLPRSPPLQVVLAASVVTKGGKGTSDARVSAGLVSRDARRGVSGERRVS